MQKDFLTATQRMAHLLVPALCALLGGHIPTATAQLAYEQWMKPYDGPAHHRDEARAVARDSSGNVVVTGASYNSSGNADYYTAKYATADGELLWERRYNGPANRDDQPIAMAMDAGGNVIVTGFSDVDYYTAKYAAADGALLWEKRYIRSVDIATAVAVDPSGNVVVTGYSGSPGCGNCGLDYYTAKYAATDGALIWERIYNGPAGLDDYATALAVDANGNVIVTGYSPNTNNSSSDYYTAKYAAANGALLWEKRSNGTSFDIAKGVAVDASGNVIVTGNSTHRDSTTDFYTIKYAATNGALLWQKRYHGPTTNNSNLNPVTDIATGIAVDASGNVVVTGASGSDYIPFFGIVFDCYTAKYAAADGVLLWERRYNGPGNSNDLAQTVAVDPSGNVFVAGSSYNTTNSDYYVAKYASANGALLWEKRYNGPANGDDAIAGSRAITLPPDGPDAVTGSSRALAIGPDGSIAITGSSIGSLGAGPAYHFATILYRETPLSISDVIVREGNAGTTNAVFTVSLATNHAEIVSVDFATTDGGATAGNDYLAATGTLLFNPGETNKAIPVAVLGDVLDETNETFLLRLSNPTNISLVQTQASGAILDDDTVPLTISGVSVLEGNTGTTHAVFRLRLAQSHVLTVSVDFATADGSALAGADYLATSGTLTFVPGETNKTITVLVNGNLLDESNKTFFVNLSQPVHAVLTNTQVKGIIFDDDKPKNLLYCLLDPGTVPPAGARQGTSVAVDGNITAVGASGQVNVYNVTTGALLHTLNNPGPGGLQGQFGSAVAISGTRVVVGSSQSLFAYVYDLASITPTVSVTTLSVSTGTLGSALAISGTRVVIGGTPYGQTVDVFDLVSVTPDVPVLTIPNPNPATLDSHGDGFGSAVAIYGTLLVIGAAGNDGGAMLSVGSAYVYNLASALPAVPLMTLTNPSPAQFDQFGWRVGISGTRVVVGSIYRNAGSGGAYIYDLSSATPTVPEATLTNPSPATSSWFGYAVGISGTRVVIGVPFDDTGANDAGSAYVYDVAGVTPTVPLLKLNNPSPAQSDQFGYAVAVSGAHVVVGAPYDDTVSGDGGSAYVYDLGRATSTVPTTTLTPPGRPALFGRFGSSVALSGTRVVVGDYLESTATNGAGSAYLYDLASATPTVPMAVLRNPSPAYNDNFGWAVGISGTRVVIGTPFDDTTTANAGIAYLYDLASGTPTVPYAALTDPSPAPAGSFGYAVSIAGTRVVVGTLAGRSYVYDLASATFTKPVVTLTNSGYAVSISGTRVAVRAGSTYVYDIAVGNPTVPVATFTNAGRAVSIDSTRVMVGATPGAGSVYVYDLASATPTVPIAVLTNSGPSLGNQFGLAVVCSDTHVVVGANREFSERIGDGRAYVYDLASTTPTVPLDTLTNPNPGFEDSFGSTVAIDGTMIVVGSNHYNPTGTNRNAAYIFGHWWPLSMSYATVTEGNAGTTNAVFIVSLITNHAEVVSVDFTTVDGSATAGSDYLAENGTLVFNPGETEKIITVPVLGDILDEANEMFFVRLSNPTNISLIQTEATGTILDDDTTLTITRQPTNQFARPGSNVTFRVSAISTLSSVTYQWRLNGAIVPNATNSTLTVTNVQFTNAGDYSVVVADSRSFKVSDTARLAVLIAPVILEQPQNVTVVVGGSATFSVAVSKTATLPINYQWRKMSTVITNIGLHSYNCSFTLDNVTTHDAGQYRVAITNAATTGQGVGSVLATLTVVTSTALPNVTLTSPTNGATFACPANINLNANASDSDGSVSRVEFYAGTNRLGSVADNPYSLTWSNVPAGHHMLVARAFDNLGAIGNSAPINITVTDPVSPTLSIARLGTNALLSWPQGCSNYRLEVTASFNPTNWAPSIVPVIGTGGHWNATVLVTNISNFFRLRRE